MMGKNYIMVRAMLSKEEDFAVFIKNNVVAVGWSDVDFTAFGDSGSLRDAVRREYYEGSKSGAQLTSKNLNEVERFKNIKKGDYIIVPYYSAILLAEAEEDEVYSKEAYPRDLANQRRVTYRYVDNNIFQVPRNELSEGLQRRLRVRGMTVSNLYEFKDEIDALFERKSYSYSQEIRRREAEERKSLKAGLLQNLRTGHTNLQTGGIGLENLVCELMQCEGYEARVLAKTKFSGKADADIEAKKEDAFGSRGIFVQVKHHSGFSGKEGIQQVIDVLKMDEYKDYEGYFVTSADISDETREFAKENNINVMDGEALVELLIDDLSKLSVSTKRALGISTYPHMI